MIITPMRRFIFGTLLFLIVFTVIVIISLPSRSKKDKTELVWVTDPNPQRELQIQGFNKMFPDCKLVIDSDNTGVMKVVVQCCAGMGPDLIDHISEYNCEIYQQAGILLDITEKAKELGCGLDTLPYTVRQLVGMTVFKDGEFLEKQYFYPCSVNHTFVLYNKNIFDKYKIRYPREDITWKQYINIANKLTVYNNDEPYPSIFGSANVNIRALVWSMGGSFMNKTGTRCTFGSKEVVKAVKFYQDLIYKHRIEPTLAHKQGVSGQGGWASGQLAWFGEGKLAMYWGARWNLIQLRRFISEQKKRRAEFLKKYPRLKSQAPKVLRIGACLIPRFKSKRRYTTFSARSTAINAGSHHIDKAFNFFKYMTTEEYAKIIIEGADSKPGDSKFYNLKYFEDPNYPGEKQIDDISLKSVQYGRITNRSFFINTSEVLKIFQIALESIIAHPHYTETDIARVLKEAAAKVDRKILKNIQRHPKQQKVYKALLIRNARPIKYHNLLKK